MLFSAYSIPNIAVPIFFGWLGDKVGARFVLVVTSALLVLGQYVFYKGADIRNYEVTLLGRFIYGLGGESVTVATSMLEATWFMGRELSFAVSMDYGVSNFAEFSNDLLEPVIYDYKGTVAHVLWAGFLLSVFSFIMSVFVYILDGKRLAMEKESNRPQTGENFDMRDIFRFHWDLWIMSLATAFSTLIWVLFNNIASEFFQMKFGFTLQTTGMLIGLEALATGFLIPFLGVFLDKYGSRIFLSKLFTNIGLISLGGLFFLLIYMFLFASGLFEVTVLVILCGVCNGTIYSCLWPTISYTFFVIID